MLFEQQIAHVGEDVLAEKGELSVSSSVGLAIVSLEQPVDHRIELRFTWAGKLFSLRISATERVLDLKQSIFELTSVPPERQKLLGLAKGPKLPPNDSLIADLGVRSGKKFTVIGTPAGNEIKGSSQLHSVVKDPVAASEQSVDVDFTLKLKEVSENLTVNLISPLRPGKKLLVLDIDYTILDTKPLTGGRLPPMECARPFLHEFLEAVYPHYDICIWSQTSWIWLETKLVELGMVGAGKNYEISFVLDKTCMFTVSSKREGKPWSHSVKALQIIWNHFPAYNASNTVHVDDLSRNFALNPKEGIKISAFKEAHTEEAMRDRELVRLTRYLLHAATFDDFRSLTHKDWKSVAKRLPPPVPQSKTLDDP